MTLRGELTRLDERVLEELEELVPDSYVIAQESWIRDGHAGDFREVAAVEDIDLDLENVEEIAEAAAEDMVLNRREYELPATNGGEL